MPCPVVAGTAAGGAARRARDETAAALRRFEQGGEHRGGAHLRRVSGVDPSDEGIDQARRDLVAETSSGDLGHGPVRGAAVRARVTPRRPTQEVDGGPSHPER